MTLSEGRPSTENLRRRAEEAVLKTRREVSELSPVEIQSLVHELQVHQIELEMQNEELRATSRELEDTRARYQELYELAPVGYLELGASGTVQRANLGAATLLGLDRQKLIGCRLSDCVKAQDTALVREHLDEASRYGRATCEVELVVVGRPQTHAVLRTSCGVKDDGYRTTLTDISDRRQAELALQELNEDLERRIEARTAELKERNRQLESEITARAGSEEEQRRLESQLRDSERLKSIGLLAGGVAHDFNNLLVAILSTADLLLYKPDLSEELRDSLSLIRQAGRSAADLTRQLLVYAGQGHTKVESLDLSRAIAESVSLVRLSLPENVELRTQVDKDLPTIDADRGQLQQVIANLLTNAIEAIGSTIGTIAVRARTEELDANALSAYSLVKGARPGRFIVLQIIDSGPGIDAEALPHIFDPFFTTKFMGRGLGLATVLGILHGHRAAARVASKPGWGTTFEIAWPIAAVPTAQRRSSSPSVVAWRGTGRALVVDDDRLVRMAVARQLKFLGFDVVQVEDGAEALRVFQETSPPFSVVLLDRVMPGLTGEQVLTELHRLSPGLPVVLMSGYSSEDLVLTSKSVAFVQKPMTLSQLQTAVCQVIDEAQQA